MTKYVDLHTHTTASDGTLTPQAVVKQARVQGLAAVAITDHDTSTGIEEAVEAGNRFGIEVIAGVELSVEYPAVTSRSDHPVHMLGLFIDWRASPLRQRLENLGHGRTIRNQKIIAKLNTLGFALSHREVQVVAGAGTVGRPHIAQVMTDKGYVRSSQDAFDNYLKKGAVAYVERDRLRAGEAISLLHRVGGLAILAHPMILGINDLTLLEKTIEPLIEAGLDGLEAYYSDHTLEETAHVIELARRHGLLISGGSDFHGTVKPAIQLGSGQGNLRIPYHLLASMKQKLHRP